MSSDNILCLALGFIMGAAFELGYWENRRKK
jgi:hypothetical protein